MGQYLGQLIQMVTDRYLNFEYDLARKTLTMARSTLKAALAEDMLAMLDRLEALLLDCQGDFAGAVVHMTRGTRKAHLALSQHAHLMDLVTLRLYLLRERKTRGSSDERPSKAEQALTWTLLEEGPWRDALQMPYDFDPTLPSVPWPTVTDFPPVVQAVQLLEAVWLELAGEFNTLLKREVFAMNPVKTSLTRDHDCIQATGEWQRYEVSSVLHAEVFKKGCSESVTPVACDTLRQLRAISGLVVLRAGYSALGPGTWLKPHFGATNRQLKLHLGLEVPVSNDGRTPCTVFRVANDTRSWEAGRVLFFDDSFEHEVRWRDSVCPTENFSRRRVVFQVVLRHPSLPYLRNYNPIVVDAH